MEQQSAILPIQIIEQHITIPMAIDSPRYVKGRRDCMPSGTHRSILFAYLLLWKKYGTNCESLLMPLRDITWELPSFWVFWQKGTNIWEMNDRRPATQPKWGQNLRSESPSENDRASFPMTERICIWNCLQGIIWQRLPRDMSEKKQERGDTHKNRRFRRWNFAHCGKMDALKLRMEWQEISESAVRSAASRIARSRVSQAKEGRRENHGTLYADENAQKSGNWMSKATEFWKLHREIQGIEEIAQFSGGWSDCFSERNDCPIDLIYLLTCRVHEHSIVNCICHTGCTYPSGSGLLSFSEMWRKSRWAPWAK
jgi:hypothetical protein